MFSFLDRRNVEPEHRHVALVAAADERADVDIGPRQIGRGVEELVELTAQKELLGLIGVKLSALVIGQPLLEVLNAGDTDILRFRRKRIDGRLRSLELLGEYGGAVFSS